MKYLLLLAFFSGFVFAAPQPHSINKNNIINVDNEIQFIQTDTIANEKLFRVIDVKKGSTFKELGYKKGDLIKKINNETIFNKSQLKSALDRQATDWENTTFDNDFSEGEINIDDKSFEELEQDIVL